MLFSIVFGLSLVSDPLSTDGGLLIADAKDAEIEKSIFFILMLKTTRVIKFDEFE